MTRLDAGMKGPDNSVLKGAMAACRGGFFAAVVFSFFINLLMLTAPLFMLQVFDRVLSSRSSETLIFLMLIAGGALLAMSALEGIRGWVLVRISGWLDREISGPVLTGSISATLRKGTSPSIQGLRDLSTFRTFLSGPSIFPIMDAPWTPIFLAVMFLLHPLLGWMSLAGALVLFSLAVVNEVATRKLLLLSSGTDKK